MREEASQNAEVMIRGTPTDVPGSVPPLETVKAQARRLLAKTFFRGELVWLLNERYEPIMPGWDIDILRQGASGRWVIQRHRYDAQSDVLHFLGERPLSDAQFRETRRKGMLFPVG